MCASVITHQALLFGTDKEAVMLSDWEGAHLVESNGSLPPGL